MKKRILILGIILSTSLIANSQWTLQNTNFSTQTWIEILSVPSADVAWGTDGTSGTSGPEITRTIDGGLNYNVSLKPDPALYATSSLEAIDGNTAWITSYLKATLTKGAIHKTTDGGATWVNMTPVSMYADAASFANFTTFFTPLIGITAGDPVGGEFEIWKTTDGGTNWTQIPGASLPDALSGEVANADGYDRVGPNDIRFWTSKGRIFHSTDNGDTWTVNTYPTSSTNPVYGMQFTDVLNGFLLTNTGGLMYQTTDGGNTWVQTTWATNLYGHFCNVPGTNYYASGVAANFSTSSDNGTTWTDWSPFTSNGINKLVFVDQYVGYAGSWSQNTDGTVGGMWKYTGDVTLGTTEISMENDLFELFPNPTSGIVNINTTEKLTATTVHVTDLAGKIVYSEELMNNTTGEFNINLENLETGIYTVTLLEDGKMSSKKLIIQ